MIENNVHTSFPKEINVFTNGDAAKPSTWSNVPYFFTETLMRKGIKVNRINIGTNRIVKTLYRFTIWQIFKRLKKHDTYDYYRSSIHHYLTQFSIRRAIKKYPNADWNLFLSFSFSAKQYSLKPTILFGDWTYEYFFDYFKKRNAGYLEHEFLERENSYIENADSVFVLFPKVANYMQQRYANKKIHYIGNVINAEVQISADEIIQRKTASTNVLFIGGIKYKQGADALIQSIEQLQQIIPTIHLDIIGMNASDFDILPPFVKCHGYLDKGKDADRKLYYDLMQDAKVFVNTTPLWSAFSATVEAMYFYNPIIITKYDEFVETFGDKLTMGTYHETSHLAQEILDIFQSMSYGQLCLEAHQAVQNFTWNNYIDAFIHQCQQDLRK